MNNKIWQKIIACLLAFVLVFTSVNPLLLFAYATDDSVTPTPTVLQEVTPTPDPAEPTPTQTPELTPTESPTPTPESTATPIPIAAPAELPTLEPSQTVGEPSAQLAPDLWTKNEDVIYTTNAAVTLNTEYKSPFDSKLSITFTKLPENPGTLSIKEIKLNQDQISTTGALSNTAYDISSDMANGTFEYTLTLPTPKTDDVEVKASEDGENFVTLGGVTAQENTLTITGLNHFTVFVITGSITNPGPDTYVGSPFDETSSQVIINEFLFNPSTGNEWIELLNKTGSNINLENWQLVDGNGDSGDLTLTGILPANGILVFEKSGGDSWLNNTGAESITLKDNSGQTIDVISYKDSSFVNGQSIGIAAEDQGICRTSDGGDTWQVCPTPTKGWFNDAGQAGKAPLLSTIDSSLSSASMGITSNIGELNNPSNTPSGNSGLYFEKAGKGKILFTASLNLTNQATVAVLQSLGQKMEITNGHIKLDSQTAADMAVTGAKIYMYGLSFSEAPDIFIKNDAGELLGTNDPTAIENINYDSITGILSFSAKHFTQFDLPATPSIPVLHTVSSPTNDSTPIFSWDDVSATPEVTSYDIEIFDSGGNSIYEGFISTTSSSFTPDDPLPGDDDYTWSVRANNAIGSSDWSVEENFTIDTTSPTVTKLGNDSTDVVLLSPGNINLVFSEVLSNSSKTAVTSGLSNGADKTLTYSWSGGTLTITTTEAPTFANDVIANVSDVAGNDASLRIVDSKLDSTQTTPDDSGTATSSAATSQVVITNPTQATTVTIDSGATNPTIDVSSFITNGAGTIPQITINSDSADIAIPSSTVITSADITWDGVIAAPTVTTVTLPETTGETKTLSTAIEVGFTGAKLSFDKAVRILLPNQAGKRAGYIRTGIDFTEITSACAADNQATGDALAVDGDCKIDVGLDMIIWTKHFTQFATYTQTVNSSSSSSTGGGTGDGLSDGLGCGSHDCSAAVASSGQVLGASANQWLAFVPSTELGVLGSTISEAQNTDATPAPEKKVLGNEIPAKKSSNQSPLKIAIEAIITLFVIGSVGFWVSKARKRI